MSLEELINKGDELSQEPYDSPLIDMWQNDVRAAVAPFGEATQRVLQSAMWFGFAITSDEHGQSMHNEMISKVQKLLSELQSRDSEDTKAQSDLISQKTREAQETLKAKFGKATFHGPVTFGDNSPANNVQVGELMVAIIAHAEKILPEGKEKQEIISKLKAITTNPSFAAVAGASLPAILKGLFGG